MATPEELVQQAYASIGRTGFGEGLNQIDPGGYEYWLTQLQTGASTPEAFQRNFETAVADYLAKNPTDPYSQYVSTFRQGTPVEAPAPTVTSAAPVPTPTPSYAYDYRGQEFDAEALKNVANYVYQNLDPAALSGGVFTTSGQSIGFSPEDLQKLYGLDKPLTTPEQAAFDIARQLMQKGVYSPTDIGITAKTADYTIVPTSVDAQGNLLGGYVTGPDGAWAKPMTAEDLAKVQSRTVQTEEGPVNQFYLPSQTYGYDVATPTGFGTSLTMENPLSLQLGSTYTGPGGTYYYLNIDPATGKPTFSTQGASTSDGADLLKIAGLASAFFGVPGMLGSALAPGLSAGAQAAIGGALMGGGTAAITGDNILKGALLGGAGGYASSALGDLLGAGGVESLDDAAKAALTAADEYAAAGTLTAGDLAAALGTTVEEAAGILQGTGGFLNSASVDQLMKEYADQANKAILGYEDTGTLTAADLANQLGVSVDEVKQMFGPDYLLNRVSGGGGFVGEDVPSGVPEWDQAMYGTPTVPGTPSTEGGGVTGGGFVGEGTPSGVPSWDNALKTAGGGLLTNPIAQQIIKALVTAGLTKGVTGMTGGTGTGGGVGALPTQGVPTYGPGYFQAVQQSYNQFMPNMPRDVSGPLEQWYNSKYGS